jgi:hypothetical protein
MGQMMKILLRVHDKVEWHDGGERGQGREWGQDQNRRDCDRRDYDCHTAVDRVDSAKLEVRYTAPLHLRTPEIFVDIRQCHHNPTSIRHFVYILRKVNCLTFISTQQKLKTANIKCRN